MKLLMYIGPLGGACEFKLFTDDAALPEAISFTHAEGQAFIFNCMDEDTSTEFARAIEDGRFIKDFNAGKFELKVRGMR